MSSLNKVTIIGNLGQDPDVRYSSGGNAITSISVATTETWKDKQTGEKKESTEWHNVTLFGGVAEIVGKYLKKGSKVYIEGKLKTEKYQDKTGQDRYSTKVVVDGFGGKLIMLDGLKQEKRQSGAKLSVVNQTHDDFDDDIPF